MGITFPDGVMAVCLLVTCAAATIILLRNYEEESSFLINIFLIALMARVGFATISHVFPEIKNFFGGDQFTYDETAGRLVEIWMGRASMEDVYSVRAASTAQAGWGMTYLTAIIYLICGKNMLAGQFFCAVIGAATAPMVYICSYEIFNNKRVSQTSALLVAFFPTFIVWSSQLLKDGLIIFLLVMIMTMVLKLQKKLNY